jgi:DNA-binding MarR family transcriptional regulator
MDQIKEAFNKVKEDMDFLTNRVSYLENVLIETTTSLNNLTSYLEELSFLKNRLSSQENTIYLQGKKIDSVLEKLDLLLNNQIPADNAFQQTDSHISPAFQQTDRQIFMPFKPLNTSFLGISTGNRGVPTDRQTNQQTNQQMENTLLSAPNSELIQNFNPQKTISSHNIEIPLNKNNSFDDAVKVLDTLDSIKKDLRLKFKRLTDQELLVFSTIYQLEEENAHIDYRSLATKLSLTESSIRDYIGKLIKKGISIEKEKVNNKQITLHISENLKKVASLPTILQLRDL